MRWVYGPSMASQGKSRQLGATRADRVPGWASPAHAYAAVCLGRTHSAIRWPTAISARRRS